MPANPICTDVVADGIYTGPRSFAVHCMNPRMCAGAGTCAWRKFHGLDKPGFDHRYRREQLEAPAQGDLF